jgi:hypothetical protein
VIAGAQIYVIDKIKRKHLILRKSDQGSRSRTADLKTFLDNQCGCGVHLRDGERWPETEIAALRRRHVTRVFVGELQSFDICAARGRLRDWRFSHQILARLLSF